jgi:uncharacterized tellurite resistance protein B-like protein
MQEVQPKTILEGYTDQEKGAYLGAIASLATADRSASPEEIEHIEDLAEAAQLSEQQREAVVRAATELSGEELKRCLDTLKNSNLRFSLVTDLIAFAEVDNNYSEEERKNVEQITQYLGVNKTQVSLLDQFVQRTSQSNKSPEEITKPGFLESLGLKDQFSNAGINIGSIGRGMFGFLGPMLLGGMLSRGLGRGMRPRSGGFGGGLGGGLGGALGGALGGGLGMPRGGGFGGLGSIFSALNGGRSSSGMGGLLSRILR